MSGLKVTTGATAEPLSTLDAKDHLRVASSGDDVLIDGYIKAARQYAENYTRRSFVNQTYRYTLDDFPAGDTIELPRSPLSGTSLVTVKYRPEGSTLTTFSSSKYIVDGESEPPRVVLKSSESWPTDNLQNANGVEVSFRAGYGLSSDVPEGVKHAMRLLIGHYHENREGVVVGSVAAAPGFAVKSLLGAYRVPDVP